MLTTYPPSDLRPQEDQAQAQEDQDGHLKVLHTSDGEIKCLRREYPTAKRWCRYLCRFPLLDNFCSYVHHPFEMAFHTDHYCGKCGLTYTFTADSKPPGLSNACHFRTHVMLREYMYHTFMIKSSYSVLVCGTSTCNKEAPRCT
ncbi:hypothetical protein B0H14DRAFT_1466439 [Mycena olivaceomarginata]|nr:hypothetical protein B0H14DRAFT_1466439 [Mycena olivaceomarginata]